ncbi:MAG: hypothetical protein ACFFBP_12895 [Promethearchaeota archaeon]
MIVSDKIKKVVIKVFINEDKLNECAKCNKTIQVINRMIEALPDFRDNIEIQYKYKSPEDLETDHANIERPAVIINDSIFSQGHVPIIKKLCKEVIELLK